METLESKRLRGFLFLNLEDKAATLEWRLVLKTRHRCVKDIDWGSGPLSSANGSIVQLDRTLGYEPRDLWVRIPLESQ